MAFTVTWALKCVQVNFALYTSIRISKKNKVCAMGMSHLRQVKKETQHV